jgi:hypothetical protein
MSGTITLAALVAPFFLFGVSFASFFPVVFTALGIGAWIVFTVRRRVAAERDSTIAYYDKNWKSYVAETSTEWLVAIPRCKTAVS